MGCVEKELPAKPEDEEANNTCSRNLLLAWIELIFEKPQINKFLKIMGNMSIFRCKNKCWKIWPIGGNLVHLPTILATGHSINT